MHRLEHLLDREWLPFSHPPIFQQQADRLLATAPVSDPAVFSALTDCLQPPYLLLYVLHTPRTAHAAGRYLSPPLSPAAFHALMREFGSFLSQDGRHDLWAHAPTEHATVVWDRHDLLHAYGALSQHTTRLAQLGFTPGQPQIPAPHRHRYWPDWDDAATSWLQALDWSHQPLRAEDEQ